MSHAFLNQGATDLQREPTSCILTGMALVMKLTKSSAPCKCPPQKQQYPSSLGRRLEIFSKLSCEFWQVCEPVALINPPEIRVIA